MVKIDRKIPPLRLHLSALLYLCSYIPGGPSQCRAYKMSELLKPQRRFQIALSIPHLYFDAYVRQHSPALEQAVEFLVSELTPFRLTFNQTNTNAAPITSRQSRHLENQVANLVFIVVTRATPRIDLYKVRLGVTLGNELAWPYVVHKDRCSLTSQPDPGVESIFQT